MNQLRDNFERLTLVVDAAAIHTNGNYLSEEIICPNAAEGIESSKITFGDICFDEITNSSNVVPVMEDGHSKEKNDSNQALDINANVEVHYLENNKASDDMIDEQAKPVLGTLEGKSSMNETDISTTKNQSANDSDLNEIPTGTNDESSFVSIALMQESFADISSEEITQNQIEISSSDFEKTDSSIQEVSSIERDSTGCNTMVTVPNAQCEFLINEQSLSSDTDSSSEALGCQSLMNGSFIDVNMVADQSANNLNLTEDPIFTDESTLSNDQLKVDYDDDDDEISETQETIGEFYLPRISEGEESHEEDMVETQTSKSTEIDDAQEPGNMSIECNTYQQIPIEKVREMVTGLDISDSAECYVLDTTIKHIEQIYQIDSEPMVEESNGHNDSGYDMEATETATVENVKGEIASETSQESSTNSDSSIVTVQENVRDTVDQKKITLLEDDFETEFLLSLS